MIRLLLFSLALFSITQSSFSQEIEYKTTILGHRFYQSGERLLWKEVLEITESNPEAHELLKKAKYQNTLVSIMSVTCGGFIGISVASSKRDQNPNWVFAYVGGALFVGSIPIIISMLKNVKKGIDSYNSSIDSSAFSRPKTELNLVANQYGIGLSLNF